MTDSSAALDSHKLALRMRSYSPRPVAPVQPRGVIDFSNRGGFTDIFVSSESVSATTVAARPLSPETSEQKTQQPTPLEPVLSVSSAPAEASPIEEQLQEATPQRDRKRFGHRAFSLVNGMLIGMAVVVFGVGMIVALKSFRTNQQIGASVSAQAPTGGGTGDEARPSEQETTNYTVAPDMPRYIDIAKLGVHSRVRETGVTADGSLGTPSNIFDAAWFNQSAKPGSAGGATLIDGHVSGPTQKGVFYGLEKLTAGDVVMIEKGNGDKLYYKVSKTEVVDTNKVDMAKLLLPTTPGKAGLNLISCTGKFNSQTQQFEQRALVYAEQIQ